MADQSLEARLAKSEAARERLGRSLALALARLSKLTGTCACGAETERVGPWRCTRQGCEVGDLLDREANDVIDGYTASLRERVAAAEADAAAWRRGVEAANRIAQSERAKADLLREQMIDMRAAALRHAACCPLMEKVEGGNG